MSHSSSTASVSPQTTQQQLDWRVRQFAFRYMAQLGLSPYWHEFIGKKINDYLVRSLIRERIKGSGHVAL